MYMYSEICYVYVHMCNVHSVIPRPVGVWRVTHSSFLGGISPPPPVISQTAGKISNIQTPFDSSVRELSQYGVKYDLEVTDGVRSGQSRNVPYFGLGDIGRQNFDVKRKQS